VRQVSDEQAMEMTIVENLQRADLNPMEQARAYARLSHEFNLNQEQIATRTGKDRASVSNYIRLLRLPKSVQIFVESGELSYGHARALLAFDSVPEVEHAANQVIAKALSVRQTESYVQTMLKPAPAPQDPNVHEAQDRLQRRLGLKVHIEDKKGKGRVIIEYAGVEDFDAILGALGE
jgi:ParB family chromosome partitioning protein